MKQQMFEVFLFLREVTDEGGGGASEFWRATLRRGRLFVVPDATKRVPPKNTSPLVGDPSPFKIQSLYPEKNGWPDQ